MSADENTNDSQTDQHQGDQHIGLSDAIEALHAELAVAQGRSLAHGIRFPVESMTVEFKMGAVKTKDGKAAFRIPVINAELGGSAGWSDESTQTVTVVFGAPVDGEGNAVRVVQSSDHKKG